MQITLTDKLAELHQYILKVFSTTGQSPSLSDIKTQFSLNTNEEVEQFLTDLEQTKAIHRNSEDPLVTHAYPFSNEPTPHRVTLASNVSVYSMCAVDALGIPFMLDTNAKIESKCLECGQIVHVVVKEEKIASHTPEGALVGYVPIENCSTPATEQCPHINFFCSQDHFDAWAKKNPQHDLKLMALDQALAQGKRIFGTQMKVDGKACC